MIRHTFFCPDRGGQPVSLTFAALYDARDRLPLGLSERGQKGDRAILLFPPGLDFIIAFFGCLLAGVIAVPMMIPRRDGSRDASAAILADCSPRFAMTRRDLVERRAAGSGRTIPKSGMDWFFIDCNATRVQRCRGTLCLVLHPDDIAFLQYTSGSTSSPKGVIVSHANLIENSEMIRIAFGNTRRSTHVSWVPLYHDMGLILNALQSFYVGALCVLLAPVSFMQRPLGWLRAIHDYRAEVAGGPNFAFDLCVRRHRPEADAGRRSVVLEGCVQWCRAGSGRHDRPVCRDLCALWFRRQERPPRLWHGGGDIADFGRPAGRRAGDPDGSAGRAAAPCSGCPDAREDAQILVGCGRQLVGERLAIVDPESRQRARSGAGRRGLGCWAACRARLLAQPGSDRLGVRSADRGERRRMLVAHRRSRVSRRRMANFTSPAASRSSMIIRGINHYPQDIEDTVQDCHPALRRQLWRRVQCARPQR